MESKITSPARVAGFLSKAFVPACLLVAFYAIHKNPSYAESKEKLNDMQLIMGELLSNGGQIVHRSDLAKFGGALSSRMIDAQSFTGDQRKKDKELLLSSGWRQVNNSNDQFCRDDVLLEFNGIVSGYYQGRPVISILASFSARTKAICK
jgi:hypothetical protein